MDAINSTPREKVPDRGTSLIVLMWLLTGLSTSTVVARFVFRAQKSIIGWDDLFMLLSMLCFYGWTICLTILCVKGGERHINDVILLGPDTVAEIQLLNWTSQVFGIMGVGAGKVSVSALLLAIMENTQKRWQKMYIWTFCIVLVFGVSLSCSILTMAQCRPAKALWDLRVKGDCINPKIMGNFGTFTGSYNTFVDASLALIPSTIFFSLKMGVQEKITLSIVFGLNILTSICSGIKTSYLFQLANRTDLTWATFNILAWVTAEFFLVIVCGSLPTLKPLLTLFRRRLGYRSKSSENGYGQQTGGSGKEADYVQMNDFRKDVMKSKASVTNAPTGSRRHDSILDGKEGYTGDDIVVEKTYKVRIQKSASEQELRQDGW